MRFLCIKIEGNEKLKNAMKKAVLRNKELMAAIDSIAMAETGYLKDGGDGSRQTAAGEEAEG